MIDVNTLIGPYPYRYVPHPDPDVLVRVMDREGIATAWVGHLPSAFYRDPSAGNSQLYTAVEPYRERLRAAPAIRPDWPDWQHALRIAVDAGAAAVRIYPPQWQLGPNDARVLEFALACGEARLPLLLTVRFEDLRQRSPLDSAGDLQAAAIRAIARAGSGVRVVVTAAGKDMIEEVHWGLTPDEQQRVLWDISWIWGPPEDHFAKLLRLIGPGRFVFGTHWPLRLTQNPRSNLDLLPPDLAGVTLASPDRLYADAARG
jgi:predicted TIM-barrel fold metal-dependent hydrolase